MATNNTLNRNIQSEYISGFKNERKMDRGFNSPRQYAKILN